MTQVLRLCLNDVNAARAILEAEYKGAAESEAQLEKPRKRAKRESDQGFWDFISHKQGDKSDRTSLNELNAYLAEPCTSTTSDPLDYWRCHSEQYPVLKTLARKYLSMQCTSVPSERLFSTAGQIVSERRSRLLPSKVQQILFLNKNIDIL